MRGCDLLDSSLALASTGGRALAVRTRSPITIKLPTPGYSGVTNAQAFLLPLLGMCLSGSDRNAARATSSQHAFLVLAFRQPARGRG